MKPIVNLKILEAVVVLLNHNSREIVFFALGILINMMLHEPIKYVFWLEVFNGFYLERGLEGLYFKKP